MDSLKVKISDKENNQLVNGANWNGFSTLYDRYYDRIFRLCLIRLFNKHTAEDICSEIWLKALSKINTFKGSDTEKFGYWIYSIANNHITTYIRKNCRRKEIFLSIAGSLVEQEQSANAVDWHELHKAIAKLNDKQQILIVWRFFEKYTTDQIAKMMNKKPSSVRVSLHRALKKLKHNLPENFHKEIFS